MISQAQVRELPHSEEAEKGVLGSILISPREATGESVEKIGEDYFYHPAHQTIYSVLVELWNTRAAIDLITVTQVLRDRNVLEAVGGGAFVTSLFTFVPHAANLGYYLEIVREKYILRQIIAKGTELIRRAYEEQEDVNSLLDDTLADLTLVANETKNKTTIRPISEGVMETIERLENAFNNKGEAVVTGLATGFYDVDRTLAGMKPGQLIVPAARPSHGKTAWAMNVAENVALEQKKPVLVFSLEMSFQELTDRAVCSYAGTSLQRLRDGYLSESDFPKITTAAQEMMKAPIYIDDTPELRILDLKARARRLFTKLNGELALIIVDYLQLLKSGTRRGSENRVLELGEISGGLKSLAKELGLPIICLAQLNREAETRGKMARPRLTDLRESGAIEQDADTVILLCRPVRMCENEEDKTYVAKQLGITTDELLEHAELNIAKQRNGPVTDKPIRLLYKGALTRFLNTTPKQWSNNPDQRQK